MVEVVVHKITWYRVSDPLPAGAKYEPRLTPLSPSPPPSPEYVKKDVTVKRVSHTYVLSDCDDETKETPAKGATIEFYFAQLAFSFD